MELALGQTQEHTIQQMMQQEHQLQYRRKAVLRNLSDTDLSGIGKKGLERKLAEGRANTLCIVGLPLSGKTATAIAFLDKHQGTFFPWSAWVARFTEGDTTKFGTLGRDFAKVSAQMWHDIEDHRSIQSMSSFVCIEIPAGTDIKVTDAKTSKPVTRGTNIITKLKSDRRTVFLAIAADEATRQKRIAIKEKATQLNSEITAGTLPPERGAEQLYAYAYTHGVEIRYTGNSEALVPYYCRSGANAHAVRVIDNHIDEIIRFWGRQEELQVLPEFRRVTLREEDLETYCTIRTEVLPKFWALYLEKKKVSSRRRCVVQNPPLTDQVILHDLQIVAERIPTGYTGSRNI